MRSTSLMIPGSRVLLAAALGLTGVWMFAAASAARSGIHFAFRPVPFKLDSCETARKYAPETMAGGVAVLDYDRDGLPDVFFTNGANIETLRKDAAKYRNRLFRNDGRGGFADVTDKAGLAGTGYDTGVAVGDFDNDGYPDIFVAGVHRNTLYHNRRDGAFEDVTAKAGVSGADREYGPLWAVGAAWVDVNNDGLLDLFVANYLSWDYRKEPLCEFEGKPEYCHPKFYKELPNQLFLNKGDGTFLDISSEAGVRAHPGKAMSAAVADYDGDGLMDIFVPNDKLFNFLFRNKGGGRFEEVALEAGVALAEHGDLISGMGTDFRDIDNDGRPDLITVALNRETFPFWRNSGKGGFADVTMRSGLAALSGPMAGYSPNIADFDNDGWKDVFVSRGHVQSPAMIGKSPIEQHNTVFRNPGAGEWTALTAEAGFDAQPAQRHRGSAVGDFNGDGKLDIVVTALSAPAGIWMNDSQNDNHWISLALEGTRSNRDGIGARIQVVTAGGSRFNHMTTAAGYASSSAGPVHFGLGAEHTVERIEIRWPSGRVQQLHNVDADRVLRVREPQ